MFDIGFWELCLVGLVSLLVIGPDQLPKVARLSGFWLGKTRRMVDSVKTEIKQELQEEEMRQILKQQADLEEYHRLLQDGKESLDGLKEDLSLSDTKKSIQDKNNESN